jgi:mycofactocin precursor
MGDEEVVVSTVEVTVASGEVEELLVEEVSIDGLCGVY